MTTLFLHELHYTEDHNWNDQTRRFEVGRTQSLKMLMGSIDGFRCLQTRGSYTLNINHRALLYQWWWCKRLDISSWRTNTLKRARSPSLIVSWLQYRMLQRKNNWWEDHIPVLALCLCTSQQCYRIQHLLLRAAKCLVLHQGIDPHGAQLPLK